MKNYSPYKLYDTAIIRTSLFPIGYLHNSGDIKDIIKEYMDNIFFRNALVLSSFDFFTEVEKYIAQPEAFSKKKEQMLQYSFYKYFNRICTRSTPFGMFSAISTISLNELNKKEVNEGLDKIRISTNLHFTLLEKLSNYLTEKFKFVTIFKLNTSVTKKKSEYFFSTADLMRNKLVFKTHSIEENEIIDFLYKSKNENYNYNHLLLTLEKTFSFYPPKQIEQFIDSCIDTGIIINSIAMVGRSNESYQDIINNEIKRLYKLNNNKDLLLLEEIFNMVNNIHADSNIKDQIEIISFKLKTLNIRHSKNKILFVNSYRNGSVNLDIDKDELLKSVQQGMNVLKHFLIKKNDSWIDEFKKKFKNSYGDKLISFNIVFDPLIGLSYPLGNKKNSDHEMLLYELYLPRKKMKSNIIRPEDKFWFDKYIKCLSLGQEEIVLTDEDFANRKPIYSDINYTFSIMTSLVKDAGKKFVIFKNTTAGSGIAYLGRFAHSNNKIFRLCAKMAEFEENIDNRTINAEITHIPNTEIGDILFHKSFHKYEIPYLINSKTETKLTIDLDDLYLGIENEEFIIYSKKHEKYVNPILSNAYNFSLSEHPAFMFLCDYQHKKSIYTPNLSIGAWSSHVTFLPRIRYKNLVFIPKTWRIELKKILKQYRSKINDIDVFEKLLRKYYPKLPNKILIGSSDQLLMVDFDDRNSTNMFYYFCKKKFNKNIEKIKVTEAFNPSGNFVNEILLNFKYELSEK